MATWPLSLPQLPLADAYEERPGPNVIRTKMDAGPAKRRRRFTTSADPHRIAFELDATQLATFKTFFKTTLAHGALSFDWVHPVEGVAAVFAFMEEPVYRNVGGNLWQVSCVLERTG